MYKKEVVIQNRAGMHARPAANFVKVANRFESEIIVKKDNQMGNAKSIMSILALGASYKSTMTIEAQGPDAQESVDTLVKFVENRFEEE